MALSSNIILSYIGAMKSNFKLILSSLVAWCIAMYVDVFEVNNGDLYLLSGYVLNLIIWIFALTRIITDKKHKRLFLLLGILVAIILVVLPATVLAPVLLIFWMSYLAESVTEKRLWLSYLLINFIVMVLVVMLGADTQAIITTLSFVAFQLFAISSTLQAKELSQQRDTISKKNLELITTQSLLLQTSKIEERQRILQNLHDGIGHQLTAMSLHNEHALQCIKLGKTVEIDAYLEQEKSAIKDTLLTLRQIVKQSRNTACLDLEVAITAIASKLPNLAINYTSQIVIERSALIEDLIYSFQEGISNAIRHGQANVIDITIEKKDATASILLIDNGMLDKQKNSTNSTFGSGLIGMKERLSHYNAQINLSKNQNNGYTLTIEIPLTQCVTDNLDVNY